MVGLAGEDLLSELRSLRDTVKDIANSVEERQKAQHILLETLETAHPIRRMLEEDPSSKIDLGDRLIKLGVALILFPDPTITDVIGSLLVMSGAALKKIGRRGAHPAEVFQELHRIREELMTIKGEAYL
jgi:hypothetical protein